MVSSNVCLNVVQLVCSNLYTNLGHPNPDSRFKMQDPEIKIRKSRPGNQDPEIKIQKSRSRNQDLEIKIQKSRSRNGFSSPTFINPSFRYLPIVNIENLDFKNPRFSNIHIFDICQIRKLGCLKSEISKHQSFRSGNTLIRVS